VPFAAAPVSVAVVRPLLPAGRMLNAALGEQSRKGVPTGGWTVMQVASAWTAGCPPKALEARNMIEARAKSLNTCRPPLRFGAASAQRPGHER
jgi:hypothetical protein